MFMRTYKNSGNMFNGCVTGKTRTHGKTAILQMPRTRRYLESLQRPDGRFSDADAKTQALVLDALRLLGCQDEKIYGRAKEYLLTLENPDWGFSSKPGNDGSDIEGTYHATIALKRLGVEKGEVAEYVLRLHRGNGSFVRDATRPLNNPVNGEVKYAYLAISALKSAGREETDVFKRAKRFILGRQHPDGGFGSCDGIFSDGSVENVYYAVGALEKLGLTAGDAKPGTEKYILDLQNADGGFSLAMEAVSLQKQNAVVGGRHGRSVFIPENTFYIEKKKKGRSDMQNTFYAVSSLDIIGRLDGEVCDGAKTYIMRLENEDGSFGHSRSEPGPLGEPPGTGTPLGTAYAVLTLGLLDKEKSPS